MRKFYVYLVGFFAVLTLAGCSPKTEQFSGDDSRLGSLAGVKEGKVIKTTGHSGFLVYGPYVPLKPGIYRLVVKGNLTGPNKDLGAIDVSSNLGTTILGFRTIESGLNEEGVISSLAFEVTKAITDAEFRIHVTAQASGSFTGYELLMVKKI